MTEPFDPWKHWGSSIPSTSGSQPWGHPDADPVADIREAAGRVFDFGLPPPFKPALSKAAAFAMGLKEGQYHPIDPPKADFAAARRGVGATVDLLRGIAAFHPVSESMDEEPKCPGLRIEAYDDPDGEEGYAETLYRTVRCDEPVRLLAMEVYDAASPIALTETSDYTTWRLECDGGHMLLDSDYHNGTGDMAPWDLGYLRDLKVVQETPGAPESTQEPAQDVSGALCAICRNPVRNLGPQSVNDVDLWVHVDIGPAHRGLARDNDHRATPLPPQPEANLLKRMADDAEDHGLHRAAEGMREMATYPVGWFALDADWHAHRNSATQPAVVHAHPKGELRHGHGKEGIRVAAAGDEAALCATCQTLIRRTRSGALELDPIWVHADSTKVHFHLATPMIEPPSSGTPSLTGTCASCLTSIVKFPDGWHHGVPAIYDHLAWPAEKSVDFEFHDEPTEEETSRGPIITEHEVAQAVVELSEQIRKLEVLVEKRTAPIHLGATPLSYFRIDAGKGHVHTDRVGSVSEELAHTHDGGDFMHSHPDVEDPTQEKDVCSVCRNVVYLIKGMWVHAFDGYDDHEAQVEYAHALPDRDHPTIFQAHPELEELRKLVTEIARLVVRNVPIRSPNDWAAVQRIEHADPGDPFIPVRGYSRVDALGTHEQDFLHRHAGVDSLNDWQHRHDRGDVAHEHKPEDTPGWHHIEGEEHAHDFRTEGSWGSQIHSHLGGATMHVHPEGWKLSEGLTATADGVPLVTSTGKVLSEADVDGLSAEAEAGYDVSHLKDRMAEDRAYWDCRECYTEMVPGGEANPKHQNSGHCKYRSAKWSGGTLTWFAWEPRPMALLERGDPGEIGTED